MFLRTSFLLFTLVATGAPAAVAQAPAQLSPRQLFDQACQTCHGNAQVPRAADPAVLRQMTPERIYGVLTTGVMQAQAQNLSDQAKRTIAGPWATASSERGNRVHSS